MKCEICENEFKNYKALGTHIVKKHNISSKEYYDKYLKQENEGICLVCGKETNFINLKRTYNQFCSVQCLNKSDYHKNKIKETCLEHYGVEHLLQSKEIKEKIKNTNLRKYNVENISQSKIIKNKVKETNLKRYGVEYATQNKEIREKIKENNIKKYGVENPFQFKEIKDKVKETNLINYGVENYNQSNEYKEKKKEETIKKYKNEFSFLNIVDYDINKRIMTCYCNECKRNYDIGLMLLGSRLRYFNFENPCTNCYPIDGHFSNQEKELVDYIKTIYKGEIIENDRNILKPLEIDIYLPEKKIAFEYNGLYWHSSEQKCKDYHLNKTIECEKQGIQLVHIFENEWINNQENIKQYIKDLIYTNTNVINNSLIFNKLSDDIIIVDRKYSNGKILENLQYKLTEILEPQKINIFYNNNYFNVYNCGYLKYKILK